VVARDVPVCEDRGPAALAHVTVTRHQDRTDAAVAGELDMSNADEVYRELLAAAHSCPRLQVDLSDLTFVDSTGLSCLDRLARTLKAQGCRLSYLTVADGAVARILHLTGMDQVLPMAGDEDPVG
jgi:anti-sigma B factor antagonist